MAVTSALYGHKIARFPSSAVCRKRLPEEELDRESEPSANKKVRCEDKSFSNKKAVSDKEEWVDMMIKELMEASTVEDAKSRATALFENLKESLAETKKAKLESMTRENSSLKQEVRMKFKTYKVSEEKMNDEVKTLKDTVSKYEDQVKSLEQTNRFLSMHLGVATGLAFF